MNEQQTRAAVVAEAKSWLGTPYHHMGDIKGAGVDCAMLLVRVYRACGLIPDIDPRPYNQQWHLHRSEEKYLGWVEQYGTLLETETPQPGDMVVYQFARCFSHGGIVIDWPLIVHSYAGLGCLLGEGDNGPLAKRPRAFYSLWPLKWDGVE